MLNKSNIEQTYKQYMQFENAISKLSYNKLLEHIDVNESNLDSFDNVFADKVCELLEVYAAIKAIKKERNKHNKLELTK